MQRQESLAAEHLPRLYNLIDPSGVLGYFDEDKAFIVNTELSWKFADLVAQLLQAYRRNPDEKNLRIALIHRPQEPGDRTSEILVLSDDTLRQIYPSPRHYRRPESRRIDSGRRLTDHPGRGAEPNPRAETDELTEFQKRNREKSVYRSIELLLEYRSLLVPDTPIFCPVLFNRNTTLDQYRTNLGVDDTGRQAALPVLEVLNLIGLIPLQQRRTASICELNDTLRRLAADKMLHESSEPKLAGHPPGRTQTAPGGDGDPYRSKAEKSERGAAPVASASPAHPVRDNAVSAHALKQFDRFRNLDHHQLARLFRGNVRTASPGTVLIRRGSSDNANYYLLQGAVKLKARDGAHLLIKDDSPAARSPLANLQPRMYSVTAVSPVIYLKIDAAFEAEVLGVKPSRDARS